MNLADYILQYVAFLDSISKYSYEFFFQFKSSFFHWFDIHLYWILISNSIIFFWFKSSFFKSIIFQICWAYPTAIIRLNVYSLPSDAKCKCFCIHFQMSWKKVYHTTDIHTPVYMIWYSLCFQAECIRLWNQFSYLCLWRRFLMRIFHSILCRFFLLFLRFLFGGRVFFKQ